MQSATKEHEKYHLYSQAKAFLGREFMLWLWKHIEDATEHEIEGHKVEIWLQDKVNYTNPNRHKGVTKMAIQGEESASNVISRLALKLGMQPSEYRLGMRINGRTEMLFSITPELSVKSWKLSVQDEINDEDKTMEEFDYMVLTDDVITSLFHTFLQKKSGTDFLPEVSKWIRSR